MSEQAGRYQRSFGGMVGAMVVLVAVVLAWVGFRALTTSPPENPVQTVDYRADVPAAKRAADFDLVAPPTLPDGWRATTVTFTDEPEQHWHLGVLTDAGRYVGLEQGRQSAGSMVHRYVDERAQRGTPVRVGSTSWATWTDPGGDTALVRRDGGTTTLVVGHDVPRSDLVSYTSSLR
ncbi:MAG: DUF4245 domain-containing protein [Nocardioidaceae bacterium]|nr:DUF4245 domain-containing protein [Nocardioidaceae bacterium]